MAGNYVQQQIKRGSFLRHWWLGKWWTDKTAFRKWKVQWNIQGTASFSPIRQHCLSHGRLFVPTGCAGRMHPEPPPPTVTMSLPLFCPLSLCLSSSFSNLPTMSTPLSSAAPSLTVHPILCFALFLIINPFFSSHPLLPPFPSTKSKIRIMKVAYYSSMHDTDGIHVSRNMDMWLLWLQHEE